MLFCLIMSTMFYGCTESEYGEGKSEPVSFIAEISSRTQTRAAVDTAKNSGTNLIVSAAGPAKGITESVSKMTRTSTADGSWPSGANIAVQQGGTTKQYTVDGTGNITSSSPFYWANKDNISVTSWYPYSAAQPTTWTVNSDQSTEANYGGSDLLHASNTFTYGAGSSNTLQYSHQTAKVVINVTRPGYASDPSNIASITIGTSDTPIYLSGTVGSDGSITATSTTTGYINPYSLTPDSNYSASYAALVIPQDMQNKQFIAIKVYNTTYYYIPTTSTPLLAGHEYDYNITIPIEYYFSDGTWGTLADNSAKTPIGVVFSKVTSTIDQSHGWTHGYAMALTNASSSAAWCISNSYDEAGDIFGSFTYYDPSFNYNMFMLDEDGYSETQAIKNNCKATYSQTNYPAFWYALNYGTINESTTTIYAAPAQTNNSGWFLPSVGQLGNILINLGGMSNTPTCTSYGLSGARWSSEDSNGDKYNETICANNINSYLSALNGNNKPDLFALNEIYRSSSSYDCTNVYHVSFLSALYLDYNNPKAESHFVRTCIAF